LQRSMAGDTPAIIIDEAQEIPARTLDELRLLLNLESPEGKLVQIVLAGQPELDEKLRRRELRQLRQRMMFRCHLPLLNPQETSAYIQSRLARAGGTEPRLFPEETVAAIYGYSKGIPRVINLLGEHALINAYAAQKRSVSPEDILFIASDFDLVENPLSLGMGESFAQRHEVLHFPQPTPEPGSLGALQLAFISELSKALNDSEVKRNVAWSGPNHPFLTRSAHPEDPVGTGVPAASSQVPALTGELQSDGCHIASAGVPREKAAASGGRTLKGKHASRGWRKRPSHLARYWGDIAYSFHRDLRGSHFTRYWGDVTCSFHRDLQAFYSNCRRFLVGRW